MSIALASLASLSSFVPLAAESSLPINLTGIVVTLLGLLIVAAWLASLYR